MILTTAEECDAWMAKRTRIRRTSSLPSKRRTTRFTNKKRPKGRFFVEDGGKDNGQSCSWRPLLIPVAGHGGLVLTRLPSSRRAYAGITTMRPFPDFGLPRALWARVRDNPSCSQQRFIWQLRSGCGQRRLACSRIRHSHFGFLVSHGHISHFGSGIGSPRMKNGSWALK